MNVFAMIFVALFVTFAVLAFVHPRWGLALYFLTFFMQPTCWWWGASLANVRWSLMASLILLASIMFKSRLRFSVPATGVAGVYPRIIGKFLIAMLLNMTAVHFLLAPNLDVSAVEYEIQVKYVLWFFMAIAVLRSKRDLLFLLIIVALGLSYWGLEARFGQVQMVDGRLEGFGGPGCNYSNELTSFLATLLPLLVGLTVLTTGYVRFATATSALLSLDIMMMCQSRGGFMGLIAAGATIFILGFAVRSLRGRLLLLAGIGVAAFFLLARNPQIFERFMTTFAKSDDRDVNIISRIQYWQSGLHMLADYPLGSGGDGFEKVRGVDYRQLHSYDVRQDRDVHNGFIDEACNWGVQGLMLRLGFLFSAAFVAWRTARYCADRGEITWALFGLCTIASSAALLVTSLAGTFLALEWGYLVPIAQVAYALVFDAEAQREDGETIDEPAHAFLSYMPEGQTS
jgi:hypothetical protein